MRKYTPYICIPSSLLEALAKHFSGNEFAVFLTCWAKAVEFRSHILPAEYGIKNLAIDTGLDTRSAASNLQRLRNRCTTIAEFIRNGCSIGVLPDGRITISGVWSYHQKLKGGKGNCGALECPALGQIRAPESRRVKELKESTLLNYNYADRQKPENRAINTILPGIASIGQILTSKRRKQGQGDEKRLKGHLTALAVERLAEPALGALSGILADVTSAEILQKAQVRLCENPREFALCLWYAKKADNPAAYFTGLMLDEEKITGERAEARRWAENMLELKAKEGGA